MIFCDWAIFGIPRVADYPLRILKTAGKSQAMHAILVRACSPAARSIRHVVTAFKMDELRICQMLAARRGESLPEDPLSRSRPPVGAITSPSKIIAGEGRTGLRFR